MQHERKRIAQVNWLSCTLHPYAHVECEPNRSDYFSRVASTLSSLDQQFEFVIRFLLLFTKFPIRSRTKKPRVILTSGESLGHEIAL